MRSLCRPFAFYAFLLPPLLLAKVPCKANFPDPIAVEGWSHEDQSWLESQGRFADATVFYFRALSSLLRGSHDEAYLRDLIVSEAELRGYEAELDNGNLWVRMPGKGKLKDEKESFAFQAHLDMVLVHKLLEKINGRDQSEKVRELFAKGLPSLVSINRRFQSKNHEHNIGADDGAGVAIMLALMSGVLDDHPPLEFLFTITEEVRMSGAKDLQKRFKSKFLLNLDGDLTDEYFIGSQASSEVVGQFDIKSKAISSDKIGYKVNVSGWETGHSAVNIYDGLANAPLEMLRLLQALKNKFPSVEIVETSSGNPEVFNFIPNSFEMTLAIYENEKEALKEFIDSFVEEANARNKNKEKARASFQNFNLKEHASSFDDSSLTQATAGLEKILKHGPLKFENFDDVFHQISNNLAYLSMSERKVTFHLFPRSFSNEGISAFVQELELGFDDNFPNATLNYMEPSGGWSAPSRSPLQLLIEREAERVGVVTKGTRCLGGIELGVIGVQNPQTDALCMGSGIGNIHKTTEFLDIPDLVLATHWIKSVLLNFREDLSK